MKIRVMILALATLAASSWAIFDGCLEKRLSREREFKLMYDCVSQCADGSLDERIETCSCIIGAIICEIGVEGAKKKAEQGENSCSLQRDDKRLERCLKKQK